MIVGISGLAGSGKDTVADMLAELVPGARTLAFAEPMKRIVSEVYDWPLDKLKEYEFKETPDPRYVRLSRARIIEMKFDDQIDAWHMAPEGGVELHEHLGLTRHEYADWVQTSEVHLTPRRALQQLGTDWGRACYENTWVDLSLRRSRTLLDSGSPLVLVSDTRFPNEAQAIRAAGGIVIAVERPGVTRAAHASEQGCGVVDATIKNDGDLYRLRTHVCQFVLALVESGRLPESAVSSSAWPDLTRACLASATDTGNLTPKSETVINLFLGSDRCNYQALVLRSLQVGMGDAWFTCYDVFSDLAQDGHLPLELADVGKALAELVHAGQVERKRDAMDRTWIYAAVDHRSDYERNAASVMGARGRNGT